MIEIQTALWILLLAHQCLSLVMLLFLHQLPTLRLILPLHRVFQLMLFMFHHRFRRCLDLNWLRSQNMLIQLRNPRKMHWRLKQRHRGSNWIVESLDLAVRKSPESLEIFSILRSTRNVTCELQSKILECFSNGVSTRWFRDRFFLRQMTMGNVRICLQLNIPAWWRLVAFSLGSGQVHNYCDSSKALPLVMTLFAWFWLAGLGNCRRCVCFSMHTFCSENMVVVCVSWGSSRYHDHDTHILRFEQNIYCNKVGRRLWFKELKLKLTTIFAHRQSTFDQCLFFRLDLAVLLYVDDL